VYTGNIFHLIFVTSNVAEHYRSNYYFFYFMRKVESPCFVIRDIYGRHLIAISRNHESCYINTATFPVE